MPSTIINTKGAAEYLGCTENWVHKLVHAGRLKAYAYNEHGVLVAREATEQRQGQGLYFYQSELKKYKARKRGRPFGAKDKKPRILKSYEKSSKTP